MIFDKNKNSVVYDQRKVKGDIFAIEIPADAETLQAEGPEWLTNAFRTAGKLAADNRVTAITHAQDFYGGGTGKKLMLNVAYERNEVGLPEQLFIKFSRNFDNELWDRARYMMISEANFAVLSRAPEFPVAVPQCLFADVDSESGTGLIITECISYGRNGIEPLYPKCMDYFVPEPVEHYKAILRGLAGLSGAHRGGQLPQEFDVKFPYNREQSAAVFTIRTPLDKLISRAEKMFDFVARYPQLFPANVLGDDFRRQFIADIPDVVTAESNVRDALYGNSDYVAFGHWNANIDNCWFWRDKTGELQAGFMDWANASQISVAQSVGGALSGAEPYVWDQHLEELIQVYVDEFVAKGGPKLKVDELILQNLLIVAVSGVAYAMAAPIAIERDIENLATVTSYQDKCFAVHENARIQLHMMTKMLSLWQTRNIGDVIRRL